LGSIQGLAALWIMAPLCAIPSIAKTRQLRRRRVAAIAATATLLVLDADPPGSVTEWTGIPKPVSRIGLDSLVTLVRLL
jgi:hypothetical protein